MYLHKIKLSLCAALFVATLGGCKDSDQPDPSRHVSKAETKEMTSFDRWLKENYTDAYNVSRRWAEGHALSGELAQRQRPSVAQYDLLPGHAP